MSVVNLQKLDIPRIIGHYAARILSERRLQRGFPSLLHRSLLGRSSGTGVLGGVQQLIAKREFHPSHTCPEQENQLIFNGCVLSSYWGGYFGSRKELYERHNEGGVPKFWHESTSHIMTYDCDNTSCFYRENLHVLFPIQPLPCTKP